MTDSNKIPELEFKSFLKHDNPRKVNHECRIDYN